MEERAACALLKRRFEEAGFRIEENRLFEEGGIRFDIDGFDPKHRVGYEYVTEEAGDGWDVDDNVKAALAARREQGELFVLVVDEADAPDAASLGDAIDTFLDELREREVLPEAAKPAKPKAAAKPRAKSKTKAPAKKAAKPARARGTK